MGLGMEGQGRRLGGEGSVASVGLVATFVVQRKFTPSGLPSAKPRSPSTQWTVAVGSRAFMEESIVLGLIMIALSGDEGGGGQGDFLPSPWSN